jgi:hypothetical protein
VGAPGNQDASKHFLFRQSLAPGWGSGATPLARPPDDKRRKANARVAQVRHLLALTSFMRVFVAHADVGGVDRTVVVALTEGSTFEDLKEKCKAKFRLTGPISLCLDIAGKPEIEGIDEVNDEDRIRITTIRATETVVITDGEGDQANNESSDDKVKDSGKKDSAVDSEEDSEEEDSEKEDSEEEDSEEEDSGEEDSGEEENSSEEEGDCSDDDAVQHKSKKAKVSHSPSSPASASVSMKAEMDDVPPPAVPTSVDAGIRERIRSMIKRGLHPNTPEPEAANSMRLAERMLRKHNVTHSEVMQTAEDASVNGDMVKVHIRNPQTGKSSTTKHWFQDLARAMTLYFNCKFYFNVKLGQRCFFAFYGIASNVYAAAFAFETAFNHIMRRVSLHAVPSDEYDRKHRAGEIFVNRATYTRMARVSYCDGVAKGLLERIKKPEETEYDATPDQETRLASVTKKVEESVLEKNKITFFKGKRRTYKRALVQRSYAAGKLDSSHIDLMQRKLA